MNIEQKIFQKCVPDFGKLKLYGFKTDEEKYVFEKTFLENQFKAVISIDKTGKVTGKVFDNDEEFLPLRLENCEGTFVGEVRNAYETILKDIRENCYTQDLFIFNQSNRITNSILQKYGDKPEFLWEQYPGCGIFRNPNTQKWYAAILNVEGSKITEHKKGIIEVIDLKLSQEHAAEIVKLPNYYAGYHMNKKYWISIILDDSISDKNIMELIKESHKYSNHK